MCAKIEECCEVDVVFFFFFSKKIFCFLKRMLCIIRERMQTFAYVHQIGRTRILGTMVTVMLISVCLKNL